MIFFLYIHKQVEFKILQSVVCCSIDNFINWYIKIVKSGSLNVWVDACSYASTSRSFPFLKSCLSFHRHSVLLIKLSGMAKPGKKSIQNDNNSEVFSLWDYISSSRKIDAPGWGENNTIPALLMSRRQQKAQGEKFTQLWPYRERTGEVARLALSH